MYVSSIAASSEQNKYTRKKHKFNKTNLLQKGIIQYIFFGHIFLPKYINIKLRRRNDIMSILKENKKYF